jgi:hypothetical protein
LGFGEEDSERRIKFTDEDSERSMRYRRMGFGFREIGYLQRFRLVTENQIGFVRLDSEIN